jgi:hypothetical protein
MYASTTPHDPAGIKQALEPGLVLAALVLAPAGYGGARPAADFMDAPGIAAMHDGNLALVQWMWMHAPYQTVEARQLDSPGRRSETQIEAPEEAKTR